MIPVHRHAFEFLRRVHQHPGLCSHELGLQASARTFRRYTHRLQDVGLLQRVGPSAGHPVISELGGRVVVARQAGMPLLPSGLQRGMGVPQWEVIAAVALDPEHPVGRHPRLFATGSGHYQRAARIAQAHGFLEVYYRPWRRHRRTLFARTTTLGRDWIAWWRSEHSRTCFDTGLAALK